MEMRLIASSPVMVRTTTWRRAIGSAAAAAALLGLAACGSTPVPAAARVGAGEPSTATTVVVADRAAHQGACSDTLTLNAQVYSDGAGSRSGGTGEYVGGAGCDPRLGGANRLTVTCAAVPPGSLDAYVSAVTAGANPVSLLVHIRVATAPEPSAFGVVIATGAVGGAPRCGAGDVAVAVISGGSLALGGVG